MTWGEYKRIQNMIACQFKGVGSIRLDDHHLTLQDIRELYELLHRADEEAAEAYEPRV